jgi:ribonuclease D
MYQVIEKKEHLDKFVSMAKKHDWLALDTEFIRERSYYSRLCLIQIAVGDEQVCVDPLALNDLNPLYDLLYDKNITKVLHAAHQDLEIFYNHTGDIPGPIFDTQPAAAVLGMGEQIGYARLVQEVLKVSLEKSQSRTDWAHRPLSEKQLDYAIDDVRYLHQIYPVMHDRLATLNRLEWLTGDFERMESVATYEPVLGEMWKRVKGKQVLKKQKLAVLRELAEWRETKAIEKDLPRRWVMSDELMIDLAQQLPANSDEIMQLRSIRKSKKSPAHAAWLQCIKKGLAVPESEWPEIPRKRKPGIDQEILTDLLMMAVRYQARTHGITPSVITSRKKVEKMLQEGRDTLSDDWRGSLVNDVFHDILSGNAVVRVRENMQVEIGR